MFKTPHSVPVLSACAVLGLLAIVIGCGRSPNRTGAAPQTSAPVTADEGTDFGRKFLAALQAKDRAAFEKMMRLTEFGHRVP